MFFVGVAAAALVMSLVREVRRTRREKNGVAPRSPSRPATSGKAAVALLVAATGASLLLPAGLAHAAIVPTVELGTSENYSVLGATTVTNTGDSVLDNSLGLWPGPEIEGFPPGEVLAPAVIDENNADAQQAQSDLTAAYLEAAGRPLNASVTSDLTGLTLVGGVYAGPSQSPLTLPGTLTLDGEGDPNSVFIFQTDSTLITGPGSTVELINGAQECNVFWQVGSSATLDTGSVFVGNILALTSITVNDSVTVHGRALAQNGEVTLQNDTFTQPTCDLTSATTTTTTTPATTTSTVAPDTTTTAPPAGGSTTQPVAGTTTSEGAASPTSTSLPGTGSNTTLVEASTTTGELPFTGMSVGVFALIAVTALGGGIVVLVANRLDQR